MKKEFYSACVNAWFATKLELDKHLIKISTFMLLLLIGFHPQNYTITKMCFGISILIELAILNVNGNLIMSLTKEDTGKTKVISKILRCLDIISRTLFTAGLSLVILGR